jgi:hypothetical protein
MPLIRQSFLGNGYCWLWSLVNPFKSGYSLITNNSFAVTRAEFPCYGCDNSLLGGIEFPVIFLGNFVEKCLFSADLSAKTRSKDCQKTDISLLIP